MTGMPKKQKIPVDTLQVSNSWRDFFLRMKVIEFPMNEEHFERKWTYLGQSWGESCDKYIETKQTGKGQLQSLAKESTNTQSTLCGSTNSGIYLGKISKLCMQMD